MISDPIGDMLTRIRNGYLASRQEVIVPHSKIKQSLAEILLKEGYLKKIEVEKQVPKSMKLTLKYEGKSSAMTQVKRISKPGKRIYVKAKEIRPVLSGLGVIILSTPKGLMTGKEAKKKNMGGEAVCRVY
jgi:small subunit ribosomal protein S8